MLESITNPGILLLGAIVAVMLIGIAILKNMDDPKPHTKH